MRDLFNFDTEETKFPFIQIARFIAALLVLADHSILDHTKLFDNNNSDARTIAYGLGGYGVKLFFVISGFIITYGNWNRFQSGEIKNFALRRCIRIVPIYWLVTLFFIAKSAARGEEVYWENIVTSLLFIPYGCFHSTCGRPLVELGWTLQFEVIFYIVFAVSMLFKRTAGLVIVLIFLLLMSSLQDFSDDIGLPFSYYLDPILLFFAMGIALGAFARSHYFHGFYIFLNSIPILLFSLLLIAGLGIAIINIVFLAASRWIILFECISLLVLSLMFLRGAPELYNSNSRVAPMILKPMIVIGSASYSLYLTHTMVLGASVKILKSNESIPFILYFSVVTIAACCFAVAIYLLFEKPSQKLLRKIINV